MHQKVTVQQSTMHLGLQNTPTCLLTGLLLVTMSAPALGLDSTLSMHVLAHACAHAYSLVNAYQQLHTINVYQLVSDGSGTSLLVSVSLLQHCDIQCKSILAWQLASPGSNVQ